MKRLVVGLLLYSVQCGFMGCNTKGRSDNLQFKRADLEIEGDTTISATKAMTSNATLKVYNRTDRIIELDPIVKTSCGCTKASLKNLVLAPNGATELMLDIKFNGSVEQAISATVSDKESTLATTFSFTVTYPDFIYSRPGRVYIANMSSKVKSQQIYVYASRKELLKRIQINNVPSNVLAKIVSVTDEKAVISVDILNTGSQRRINEKFDVYDSAFPQLRAEVPIQVTFSKQAKNLDINE